jgi:hypothetical protein
MQAQAARPRIPVWLIIVYVLALATILIWPFIAFMSVFAFDAPGSADDPAVWTGVITVLSYPLLPLVGIPASFFMYRANHKKAGVVLAAIGAIPLGLVLLGLVAIVVGNAIFFLRPGI